MAWRDKEYEEVSLLSYLNPTSLFELIYSYALSRMLKTAVLYPRHRFSVCLFPTRWILVAIKLQWCEDKEV